MPNINPQPAPAILATKKHFDVLDGLRGVAALGVVVFHFMEWVFAPEKNFIGHGFLAVDFFFCLSGFVIGYAYDERLPEMGRKEFFISRLIRLHPLVVLGSVLGLIAFFIDPYSKYTWAFSIGQLALMFITSLLMIPYPVMEQRGFNNFTFNAPAWSLFWEYIANIVYAFILHKASRLVLMILLVITAGTLAYVAYKTGNLMGGWMGPNFWEGGARVAYSFTAGLFIYRANWIIKNKLGFIGLAILLAAALMMPVFSFNAWMELFVIVIYFPLLVALGAGASLSPTLRPLCVFSGRISYPLYMTHYAVIWIFGNYFLQNKPSTGQVTLIILIATPLLLVFAWLAMKYFDEPVRRYFTKRRKTI